MEQPNEMFPNFFTQIPSFVMQSKDLNSTDKIIYGVVYTMLNVTRKCYMSNAKIANEIGSTPKTVSRSITKLSRLGLINVQLTYKNGTKEVDKRFLTLCRTPILKNEQGVFPNMSTPMLKNEQENKSLNKLSSVSKLVDAENSALNSLKENFEKTNKVIEKLVKTNVSKFGSELVIYTIENAAKRNVKPEALYVWLEKAFKAYASKDIKSIAEAKQDRDAFVNNQFNSKKKNRSRKKLTIRETLPDWAKDDYSSKATNQSNTTSEDKDIQAMLDKFNNSQASMCL